MLPWRGMPGFDGLYGLEVLTMSDEEVSAQVAVRDELKQPAGLVHGGVFASIAESITSMATWFAVQGEGKSAQGLSNQTSFLRPILDGTIHAVARRRHRGRTTWVWEVDITDDEGRLCALVRMTIAVRDEPDWSCGARSDWPSREGQSIRSVRAHDFTATPRSPASRWRRRVARRTTRCATSTTRRRASTLDPILRRPDPRCARRC